MRALPALALFLAAFLAVRAAVADRLPERLKVEYLAARADRTEVVFIGSSRVWREIDPEVFDARCAAAGRPLRSLNLGMQGMRFPETVALARRALALPGSRLRWLVLELSPYETAIEPDNRLTARVVSWHDTRTTLELVEAVLRQELPIGEKLSRIGDHLLHWGYRTGNIGRGPEALERLLHPAPPDFAGRRALGPAGNGFLPLDLERGANFQARRRLFLEDLPRFQEARDTLRGPDPPDAVPDPILDRVLHRLQARCAERGVGLVLVILPVIERRPELHALAAAAPGRILIRFDDPDAWPEFYRARNRFDIHHLNAAGARLLSEALADEFLRRTAPAD
ncbi:MAG: hypothetical protein D6702_04275 [Planctomycetota bacterium]|nr:MAG: hypothetical protein D6702_04275 [Planctomycetota bacterium]